MALQNNIYFLRHFETENNRLGIISGQSDSKLSYHNIIFSPFMDFDRIYCSPSERCQKTVEFLCNGERSNVVLNDCLLERNMGKLEGHKKSEVLQIFPDLFHDGLFDLFATPSDGESYQDFHARVKLFYEQYLVCNSNDKILVCSHNQTLKLLRLLILQKEINYKTWCEYRFPNGKIVTLV